MSSGLPVATEPRRRRSRPTITDVARQAGVSTGTVSHVLNGSRDVSAERRERVMEAVKSLGYVPNLLAQSLRRNRATMVGLCMPHASFGYFVALSEAFESLAAKQGYDILHVFSRVAKMMAEGEPMLFGDFYQDENGFWRPKYRKV